MSCGGGIKMHFCLWKIFNTFISSGNSFGSLPFITWYDYLSHSEPVRQYLIRKLGRDRLFKLTEKYKANFDDSKEGRFVVKLPEGS